MDIDKEALYGEYLRSSRWRDDLHRRAAHKALDIADDEMSVSVNQRSGLGWKELATLGALALGAWGLYQSTRPAAPAPPADHPPAAVQPAPAGDRWWEYTGRVWQPGETPSP